MSRLRYARTPLRACALALIAAGLLGCGSGEPAPGTDAWTTQEGALHLQETLRISEGEDFYFARIADVAVADDGRIYVSDNQAYHVKVLSPNGALQDTVGTQGEGPGEFRHPRDLALARGDSLYVMDGAGGRVHVFTPELAFERVFSARTDQGTPINMMVPDGAASSSDRAFFFVYSPGARAVVQKDAQMAMRPISLGGTVGGTFVTAPPYRMTSKDLGEGRKLFLYVPFTPAPHFALGPTGRLHYAWSDSLTVTAYGSAGQPERTVRVRLASTPPVTDDEIAAALDDRPRGREQIKNEIPASKPAFNQFLVDDEGRYWFGRPTATPDSTAWWVATPDDKRVATTTLPSKVEILSVTNGQAYGKTTTEMGAPALVRYDVGLKQ
jgi:sugar lactone lactonase YvrE